MLKFLTYRIPVHVEVLLLVWIFIGGVAFADSLDLSDDLSHVASAWQQAVETDSEDDLQDKAFFLSSADVILSVPCLPNWTPAFLKRPLSPPTLARYQALCTYRI